MFKRVVLRICEHPMKSPAFPWQHLGSGGIIVDCLVATSNLLLLQAGGIWQKSGATRTYQKHQFKMVDVEAVFFPKIDPALQPNSRFQGSGAWQFPDPEIEPQQSLFPGWVCGHPLLWQNTSDWTPDRPSVFSKKSHSAIIENL